MAGLGLLGSAGWPGLDTEPAALEGGFALLVFCSWAAKGTPKPAFRALCCELSGGCKGWAGPWCGATFQAQGACRSLARDLRAARRG